MIGQCRTCGDVSDLLVAETVLPAEKDVAFIASLDSDQTVLQAFDKIVLTELDGADVERGTVRDIPPYGFCKGFVVGGEDIAVCEACT